MLIDEVLNEIQSRVKPYVGLMSQSTFSNAIRSIKAGTYKEYKKTEFLRLFGYTKSIEQWEKKLN